MKIKHSRRPLSRFAFCGLKLDSLLPSTGKLCPECQKAKEKAQTKFYQKLPRTPLGHFLWYQV